PTRKFVTKFIEEKVDLVLHCGDIVAPFMWKPFEDLKKSNIPLHAVFGNNDGERAGLKKIFSKVCQMEGEFYETEIDGKKVCMFHHLSPNMVEALAKSSEYDVILKGHTHERLYKKIGNTLVVNPGEACGLLSGKPSAAIINLNTMNVDFLEL
ncbi:MAG: YfcE family phosphodiesterase, partial [Candidatus Lokiarchaeota archaeon]|nr:YfcE family phosphodiesterase [Candidatus Lokiarchaeota archaeon]